jgi:hypothetical protein
MLGFSDIELYPIAIHIVNVSGVITAGFATEPCRLRPNSVCRLARLARISARSDAAVDFSHS